jgi:O-antigen/teichoic acid export membrane protein
MNLKKNIIANFFGQFYTIIIGIVMVPFYLQYLGAEAYGLVGFFALMQSWMMLLDMGISPTLGREVAKVRSSVEESVKVVFKKLLHSLEFVFIIVAVIITSSILLFSFDISSKWLTIESMDINTVSYCISLMGVMIGLRFLSSLYRSGINGAEEQVWLSTFNIIIVTFKFVGVFLILYFISTDVLYFFKYQMIIAIVEFIILAIKFYKVMDIGRFKLYFSYESVKPILPFAMGIAYTGGIWILLTQLDKLLLSGVLPLAEYGYFALVGMIANAVLQLMRPIALAIQPKMVSLIQQGREKEMIVLYKKATQLMSVIVFSVVAIIGIYSYELLYSWTGNIEASKWAKDILFWYVMGNGILTIAAFQYSLQFGYGNLKMHIYYNTFSALISIPLIIWSAYNYGATGVAIVWFVFRLVSFLIWTPIVHHKFAPGVHKNWIIKDIMPIFVSTILFILLVNYIDFSFDYTRGMIFFLLLTIGFCLLVVNSFVSSEGRKMIINIILGRKRNV